MRPEVLRLLCCPACAHGELQHAAFEYDQDTIRDGVVWCPSCSTWYPIEDRLLELLTGPLAYQADRTRFWGAHATQLTDLGLHPDAPTAVTATVALQLQQQTFFDGYSAETPQSYCAYEQTPFWRAADQIAFTAWRTRLRPESWLLDVGCAQGRSTFKLADLDLNIVAFDVSKRLIRQAIERAERGTGRARLTFLAADAASFPFADASFDTVLVYGVLHHLPDPEHACREVARVLKAGGRYFGSENNPSVFRWIFDLLQKWNPLWEDDAGPEALISGPFLQRAFDHSSVRITTRTSVFLPPHLINLLSEQTGYRLLRFFDRLGGSTPCLRKNGGLILIEGEKARA